VRDRLGFKSPTDPDRRPSRDKSVAEGFSWVPPGLPSHKVCVNAGERPASACTSSHNEFLKSVILCI
jgi:hypothetical protein